MAFGLSFGKKKSTTNQTSTVDKTEDLSKTGTTTQSGTQSSTSNTAGTQTTTGSSTGQQLSAGTSNTASTGTQQQTQSSTSFSGSVLNAIESAALAGFENANRVTGPRSDQLTFDPESFVAKGMAAAENRVNTDLNTNLGALFDSVGGTGGGNSMAALLQNRMNADAASSLAGTEANLTAQGQQILRENIGMGLAEQGQSQAYLNQILQSLKGGSTTQTGTTVNQENVNQQTQNTASNAQQTSQNTATNETNTTNSILSSIISELINARTTTQGTETVQGKTKSGGGGFSLAI